MKILAVFYLGCQEKSIQKAGLIHLRKFRSAQFKKHRNLTEHYKIDQGCSEIGHSVWNGSQSITFFCGIY